MKALIAFAAVVLSTSSLGCASANTVSAVAHPIAYEGARPLTVRTDAGSLWVGAHAWSETRRAWVKPAKGDVEAMEIRAIDGGHEITFRQGGAMWRGEVDAEYRSRGPLVIVAERADGGDDADAGVARGHSVDGGASGATTLGWTP
jgi:hypothetical protein